MIVAPLPDNENQRITRLRALDILDTGSEVFFEAIVKIAADICNVPISLVTFVDADRQWFKANYGLQDTTETSRADAFCAHTILNDEILEISDALSDYRFADNPLVLSDPNIRFYAGAPLTLAGDVRVGALCVIDREPKTLTSQQRNILKQLSQILVQHLESREKFSNSAATLHYTKMFLEHLYAVTPAMILTVNATHHITSVSNNWLTKTGYSREDVIGKKITDFLMPESEKRATNIFLPKLFVEGSCVDVELQMRCKDSKVIDVMTSAMLERDQHGNFLQVICIANDITLSKSTDMALADQLAYNKALISHMVDGVVTLNTQGVIESINPAASKIFGYPREEIAGKNFTCLIPTEDAKTYEYFLSLDSTSEISVAFSQAREAQGFHKNGKKVPVEISLSHYLHHGDRVYIVLVRDITERKEYEHILSESRRQIEETKRRFEVTSEAAHLGLWEWDIQQNKLTWDNVMFELYDVDNHESLTLDYGKWRSRIHPDDIDGCEEITALALSGQAEYKYEFRVVWRDKSVHYLTTRATVERDQDGKPLRMLGVSWDVTERRIAEKKLRENNMLLERTGYLSCVGGWLVDLISGSVMMSDEACRIHDLPVGYMASIDEALGFYTPESRVIITQALENAIAHGIQWDVELEMISAKGRQFWARSVGAVEFEHGKPMRLYGALQDVTQRKEMERELAENLQLMQITLESIADAVITTDICGKVKWMNPVAEKLTGWRREDAIGKSLNEIYIICDEYSRQPVLSSVMTCLAEAKTSSLETDTFLIAKNGAEYSIEDSASPIRNIQGGVVGVVLVFRDVSQQRQHSNEMNYRAKHDSLTGLVNRIEFEARLERVLKNSQLEHNDNALMYIDLDQFKVVNDACGHAIGDQLLIQVTALIQSCVRNQDLLARIGGDEFAVLLENCDVNKAQRVGQNICDAMDEFRFQHDGRRFRVGTSIGLVPVDDRWPSISEILQAADTSCYAAKDEGRNRVHIWFDADYQMQARHGEMQWVSRIEQALDDNRFELYGQRISSIEKTQEGMHCEILLRMIDVDGTVISPGAFLPAAERFHMAQRIDRWVLRNVFEWMSATKNNAHNIDMIAINLSGQSIGDKTFQKYLVELIALADFDVRKLCFEITETVAITNLGQAKFLIEDIRRLGVKVALDDFGAGASSFGYLKTLPVDFLKIDGQFVTDLLEDALDYAAVRCFQDVAVVVGVKTIAEFVEREDVLATLKALGIDYAQGYLIHHPEPLFSIAHTA